MTSSRNNQIIRFGLDLGKTLGMHRRDKVLRTAETWHKRGVRDPRFEGLLLERLRPVFQEAARHPDRILFPGPRYDLPGEVFLGRSSAGGKVRLPRRYLNAHTLIVGNSGAGKSVLLSLIICQLSRILPGFLVTDMFKREFRHLLALPFMKDSLEVIRWNQLRINPLEPPAGISPVEWASTISGALCNALQLPYMSTSAPLT